MTLAFLTAIYRRERLADLVLRYYARHGLGDVRLAMHSEPDAGAAHRLACLYSAWHICYWPNEPLGHKWNAGLSVMRDMIRDPIFPDIDAVLKVDSDNLLTPAYLDRVRALLGEGYDLVRCRDEHVYDARTGRLVRLSPRHPGSGAAYSVRLLDRLAWRLWDNEQERLLNSTALGRAQKAIDHAPDLREYVLRDEPGCYVLDVKAGENMWTLDGGRLVCQATGQVLRVRFVEELRAGPWLRAHYPDVAEDLLTWNQPATA